MPQQNAIVLYREREPLAPYTPFEEFLLHLLTDRLQSVRTMAGSAEWSDIPFERVVADGLWLIVLKTAKKIERSVATEADVVQDIAPRVNRVLNAGLLLSYPSMGNAAYAFRQCVSSAEHADPQQAPRALSELWSRAAARFFADALKQASLIRAAIWNEAADFIRGSMKERDGGGNDSRDIIATWLRILDLNQESVAYFSCNDARSWLKMTRLKIRRERLLARIPMRIDSVPSDVMLPKTVDYLDGREVNIEGHGDIERMWTATQILLAAAEAPDADYLTGETYLQGVRTLASLSDAQVLERFRTRIRSRSAWFVDADPEILDAYLRNRLKVVRAYTNVLDLKTVKDVIIQLPRVAARPNASYMLEYAMNAEPRTFGHHDIEPTDEEYRNLLPWDSVTAPMFRRIIKYQAMPFSLMAEGISRMPESRRQAAAKILFDHAGKEEKESMDTSAFLRILLETEGVLFEERVLIKHLDMLPATRLRELLLYLIEHAKKSSRYEEETFRLIARTALKLPAEEAGAIIGSPRSRQYVTEVIVGTRSRIQEISWLYAAKDQEMIARLREHIGADLWCRLVLGAALKQLLVVCGRLEDKACPIDPEIDNRMATWEDLADADLLSTKEEPLDYPFVLHEFLQVDRDEAREILKTHSEREIYDWLFEGDRKGNSWRLYERKKRAYARMIDEMSAPSKRARPKKTAKKSGRKKRTR